MKQITGTLTIDTLTDAAALINAANNTCILAPPVTSLHDALRVLLFTDRSLHDHMGERIAGAPVPYSFPMEVTIGASGDPLKAGDEANLSVVARHAHGCLDMYDPDADTADYVLLADGKVTSAEVDMYCPALREHLVGFLGDALDHTPAPVLHRIIDRLTAQRHAQVVG